MGLLSGYRVMWMLVMFDLPVKTPKERKDATQFRKYLLELGFEMAQLSVYLRHCASRDQTDSLTGRVTANLPPGGQVDILLFTDKQYESIVSFHNTERQQRKNPHQLTLF